MKAQVHQDFARERLSPHFVYESYDEESHLFFNRGSVGFILIGNPLVGTSLHAQGEIAEYLRSEDNLPAGSSFQVLLVGNNKIKHLLHYWQSFRKEELFQKLASKRVEFIEDQAKAGLIKDSILLITVTVPSKQVSIEDMERRREILKSSLNSIGLYTENVDSKKLLSVVRGIFGWEDQQEYEEVNIHELLSEQILPSDFRLEVQEDGLKVGKDKAIVSLEVVKRPRNWRLSLMDLFIGNELRKGDYIKSNYLIHVGAIVLPSQGIEKASSMARREALGKNIMAGMDKFFPDLREEYEDLDLSVRSLQDDGNRMIHLQMNVMLSDSVDKIKESVQSYQSMMRRSGFYFKPNQSDHLITLLSCLPMQMVEEEQGIIGKKVGGIGLDLKKLGRGIKTVSNEMQSLLPIIGEWKGDILSPGMLLTGRRGQIMYWSPFGKALVASLSQYKGFEAAENYNVSVAGVSGAGKSVFLQELMWSVLGVGGKVFVFDYGRSFKRSCMRLKGNYIEFDVGRPISINPFSEVPEDNAPSSIEARIDFLGSFPLVLATMAAPKYGTNDLQQPMLQQALIEVWKNKGSKAEVTDIAQWLLARHESYAQELGNMLFPFTKEGQYGRFFSGKAELTLNSRVVVIETDNLRNFPDLMSVITQMTMVHINRTMAKDRRDIPSLIIFDEIVKTLKSKKAGEFVDEASRIVRKYNNSIAVATQQLTDFFPREGGSFENIFANSSYKVILKQNADTLVAMRAIPQLSHFVKEDWQLKLLQSVHSIKGQYSEAAIYGPDVQSVIGRLKIDPFSMLLLSTDANEYQQIENRLKQGMSLTAAIEDILQEREAG